MLSVLVLFVVITLSIQIGIGTMTDARVARNDLGLAAMDDAIESALLEVSVQLQDDAAGGEEEAEPGMDMGLGGDDPTAALEAGGGQGSEAVDSKEDEWARPQRTEINGMELRIFIQDEDSKYNVLKYIFGKKLPKIPLDRYWIVEIVRSLLLLTLNIISIKAGVWG